MKKVSRHFLTALFFLIFAVAITLGACETRPTTSSSESSGQQHAHTAGEWIIDSAATCTNVGSQHKECTECGEILETEEIPLTSHNFDFDHSVITIAEDGSSAAVEGECTACHAQLDQPYCGTYVRESEGFKFNEQGIREDISASYLEFNGNTYYVINNIIVKNYFVINGEVIDFGDDGVKRDTVLNDIVKVGDDNYYVINNEIQTGNQLVGDKIYNFGTDGKQKNEPLSNQYVEVNGNVYYVINNIIVKNYFVINGEVIDFGDDGVKRDTVLNDIVKVGDDNYYVINNEIQTGNQLVGDKIYDFGTDGKQKSEPLNNQYVEVNGNIYYVINNIIVKNYFVINGEVIDFGNDGVKRDTVLNDIVKVGNDNYYVINNEIQTGNQLVGDKVYDFGTDGKQKSEPLNNQYVEVNGNIYYVINNIIVKNYFVINGEVIDFGNDGVKRDTVLNDIVKVGDDNYYVINNEIQTGNQLVGDKIYDFGTDGKQKDTVFDHEIVVVGNNKYYAVGGVIVVRMYVVVINHIYYFGDDGCALIGTTFGSYEFGDDGFIIGSDIYIEVDGTLYEITDGIAKVHEHTESDWVIDKAATCTEAGSMHKECTKCGATITIEEIAELGHDIVEHVAKAATCTEVGWEAYETCARCDFSTYVEIPMIDHTYVNGACSVCGAVDPDYSKPNDDVYRIEGDYIYFGSYPQTDVTASMSTALASYVSDLPSNGNNNGWTSYKYYINSNNETDFMWYKDVTYTDGNKYRAVYFTSYRPLYTSSNLDSTYQDDNDYNTSNVYWFRYDEIKWRILSKIDTTATILAELTLDSQDYNYTTSSSNGYYANNYANSSIRKWLNETFYNTAFNNLQKALINTVEVDNSARSTNPDNNATYINNGENSYACANTQDKVWLLSLQEVTRASYGFNTDMVNTDITRRKQSTAYAQCQGVYVYRYTSSEYNGNSNWWLRSSLHSFGSYASEVYREGDANHGCGVEGTYIGIVPALQISLKPYTLEGDYIYFGSYPQTDVTESMSTALASYVSDLPSNGNNNGWTSYKYYIKSSNEADFMWYKDITYTDGNKYRAVYFTSYRPYYTSFNSSTANSRQDDNGYNISNLYWFRYDEIKWKILRKTSNDLTVFAELILDNQAYNSTLNNNYEKSSIRAWLNEEFYNSAFNDKQKAFIKAITVDNSARSTNPDNNETYWDNGKNSYACENTQDKIWLLSQQDVTCEEYGFYKNPSAEDVIRRKQSTAYAQCQGLYVYRKTYSSFDGKSNWWLRSPNCIDDDYAFYVKLYGSSSDYTNVDQTYGVVPALQIAL